MHKNHLGGLGKQVAGPYLQIFWFSRSGGMLENYTFRTVSHVMHVLLFWRPQWESHMRRFLLFGVSAQLFSLLLIASFQPLSPANSLSEIVPFLHQLFYSWFSATVHSCVITRGGIYVEDQFHRHRDSNGSCQGLGAGRNGEMLVNVRWWCVNYLYLGNHSSLPIYFKSSFCTY